MKGVNPSELLLGVYPCQAKPVTVQGKNDTTDSILGFKENTAVLLCSLKSMFYSKAFKWLQFLAFC